MKQSLIFGMLMLLTACSGQPKQSEPIQGTPVGGQMQAYTEMCEREPESPLCVNDISVTHSNLNQQWCDLCAQDPALTYCKYLRGQNACDTAVVDNGTPDLPQTRSEAIQGEAVRIRAQAYEEMCRREYNPTLCPPEYKQENRP